MNEDSEKSAEHLIADLRNTIVSFEKNDKSKRSNLSKYSFIGLFILTVVFFLGFYIGKISSPGHRVVVTLHGPKARAI